MAGGEHADGLFPSTLGEVDDSYTLGCVKVTRGEERAMGQFGGREI